ncbi:putative gluconokinase [Smittium culicis]|uniref:gluconokinase n=1 Tax=Smittium culicis TaxID=133412 RepID=A0A1R1Y976_9FUNG|nr:putative gluconokinase [Smittium culicis]
MQSEKLPATSSSGALPLEVNLYVAMGVTGCGKSTIAKMIAENLKCAYIDADDFHPPENVNKMKRGIPLTDEDRIPWLEAINRYVFDLAKDFSISIESYFRIGTQNTKENKATTNNLQNEICDRMSIDTHFMPNIETSVYESRGIGVDNKSSSEKVCSSSSSSKSLNLTLACSALRDMYRIILSQNKFFFEPKNKPLYNFKATFIYLELSMQTILGRLELRKGHFAGADLVASQFATLELPKCTAPIDIANSKTSCDLNGTNYESLRLRNFSNDNNIKLCSSAPQPHFCSQQQLAHSASSAQLIRESRTPIYDFISISCENLPPNKITQIILQALYPHLPSSKY